MTTWIYVFAYYDHDISGELQEMTVGNDFVFYGGRRLEDMGKRGNGQPILEYFGENGCISSCNKLLW